ncbi:ribonuclease H-like domain-containing protein [Candidatus Bipolaricaulota bacterium]|nr:ribonuclease H-like domain-containing protein [Candidatus Bipolaricaulota bacterium]
MSLSPLAIDIETVGLEWEDMDEEVRNYLLNRGKKDVTKKEVINRLPLSPGTGRIISIGMWRPEEEKGGVLLEKSGDGDKPVEWAELSEETMIYRGSESEILTEFWRYISQGVGRLITFNGRSFDGPFLMLRSALLGIEPTRSFSPYRYSFSRHCDLAEVVSFFGARRLESLDFWCRQAGIEPPKTEMDGSDVDAAYREGKIEKIGEYNLRDARATAELFNVLKPVIDSMQKEL